MIFKAKWDYLTDLRNKITHVSFWQHLIPAENPFFELAKDKKPTHKPCFVQRYSLAQFSIEKSILAII